VFKIRQEKKLWTISNKSLVAIKASLVIAVLIGLVVFVASVVTIFADGPATIWTDKPDYNPGETVLISGSGFAPNTQLTKIDITRPDLTIESCPMARCPDSLPVTNDTGSFSNYPYLLNGIEGTYTVNVSDGTNSVQTTFTDHTNYACSQSCTSNSNCIGYPVGSYWYYDNDGTGECGYYSTCSYDQRCRYENRVCADSSIADGVPSIGGTVRTASATCDQDSDCPVGTCVGKKTPSGNCQNDCACGTNPPVCIQGSCGATCDDDSDCSAGQICNDCECVSGYRLNPQHDTYVKWYGTNQNKDTNYDADSPGGGDIHVKWAGGTLDRRRSYLKFDLTNIPDDATITSAILRLYQFDAYANTDTIGVYGVSNSYSGNSTSWTETGLTWNNAPTDWSTGATTSVDSNDGYKELTVVTADVQSALSGNIISLAVKFSDEVTSKHHDFCDMEGIGDSCDSTTVPELVILYTLPVQCSSYSTEIDCNAHSSDCNWCASCNNLFKNVNWPSGNCIAIAASCQWDGCKKDCGASCESDADCSRGQTCDISTCQCTGTPWECTNDAECSYLNDDCADGICNLGHTCEQRFKSGSTICRVTNGDCDIAEYCTGSSATCPSDSVRPNTYECRAGGVCDPAENCDGTSKQCPTDIKSPAGTDCGLCEVCDGLGSCAQTPLDDSDCGIIDCDELDTTCRNYNDLTTNRCKSLGVCKSPNSADCTDFMNAVLSTPCEADGLFCTVDHCDGQGSCAYLNNYDCSVWNLPEVATCNNNPDGSPKTWDYAAAVPGVCNETADQCEYGTQTVTHTCADGDNTDGVVIYNLFTQTCSAECDGAGIECTPKLVGDYCFYDGNCSTNPASCACNYASNQYCPVPGTVINGTCYYGTHLCTENGCGLLTAAMGCNNYCDPLNGPKDTIGPTTSGTTVNPVFNNGNFNATALANDTCSNIKKSEYFLGHSSVGFCGIPGTGAPMDATDGLFDELIEDLKKDNVLYNVFDGLNWICIQSQDNATNWGNCDCAYFDTDTLPPDCSYDIYLDQTLYPKEYLMCGNNAWLNATVCDEQSNIQGGEYFVDFNFTNAVPAPWSGTWMNVLYEFDRPSDGHHCAILGSLVNTSNLSDGTHYIKLRGKDIVENWGKIIQCKNVSFIKDTKPPITNKTLIPYEGQQHTCEASEITAANLPANASQLTNGCQFVKAGTQVVLNAADQDTSDHEYADNVRIHWKVWYKVNAADPWVVDQEGVGAINQSVTITLNKDSYHLIEYWAVDSCGWEETHHYELDIVDTKLPVTVKTVGDPKLSGSGFDYWITQQTPITLNCSDQNPHPSDHVILYAKYKVDDGAWVDLTTSNGYIQFHFNEDSVHTLEYWCVDQLGNTETHHIEVDKVDTTPPNTTKTYGTPLVTTNGDYPKWINSSTPITLTATDGGAICHIGVNKTYWRNTIVDDRNCLSDYDCQMYAQGSGTFTEYTGQFTKPTESCHLIEYYSVDLLGNAEPVKKQCVYVENTPPVSNKTLGTPKHECDSTEKSTYGINDCWYLTDETKLELSCSDLGNHPVDNVTIHYKVEWKENWGDSWQTVKEETVGNYKLFYYEDLDTQYQDSYHKLTWYCVDALGNKEQTHTELDMVDTKPPISNKTLGIPNHTCNSTEQAMYYPALPNSTNGCYFINQSTPITITCSDQNPHPVDHAKIWYRYYLSGQTPPVFIQDSDSVTFTYPSDSAHVLEWYCVDELGNTETTHVEYDIVDTQKPNIVKTIVGPQHGYCPPLSISDDCFIDGVTTIHVESTDPESHPVDHVTCDWDYTVTDGTKNGTGQKGVVPPFDINFPEESTHVLTITCKDALGNEETDVEKFIVDKTPPTTTKTYGTSLVEATPGGYPKWITSQTPITLTVDDTGLHKSGIKETKYRVTPVDDNYCTSQSVCQGATGSGDFLTYTTSFTIGQQSCHLIEYYSKDNVDKTETVKKQCVYVDNTPPAVTKEVGEPKHACEQRENCDLYITNQTPITLICTDQDPHPVDNVKIYYRYYIDGETPPAFTQDGSQVTFNIPQDSRHRVEYYCVDALGNSNGTDQTPYSEIDVVDNKVPIITKTVGDPKIPCDPQDSSGCVYWVRDHVTPIDLYCSDDQPHPVDHVKLWYRILLDGQVLQDWTDPTEAEAHKQIIFNEDSVHTLQYYCVDELGNSEGTRDNPHEQVYRVDSTAPETNKTIGDPKWRDENLELWWVTSDTQFTLTAVDKQDPCTVGVDYLHVKIEWDNNCDGSVDYTLFEDNISTSQYNFTLGQFYHPGETKECLHKITWYAVDKLGNEETPEVQYHKVDDTPPHVLILKPVDGWYSDGEDIPIVALAEDLTNPHGTCNPFSGMCNVGIENGRQCYAYLIDVLPHFQSLELQTKGTLLYNNVSHECQGYATIPSPSGLPDGIAFLAVSADDNLGNMGNSLMEIFHTIAMECGCEEDNIYYCPSSCIVDVLQDIVTIWNLPKIGIDNNPIDVTITEPLEGTVLKGTPFNISANISDSANGEITSAITTGTPCYITLGGVSLGSVPYINEERKCSGTMVIPSSMPQGLHELKVEIADNAGNIGFGVINVIHDTIPPTDVTIWKDDEKKDLYYDQDGDYTLRWEAIDANLDYYELFENGISIYNTTGNNTLFIDKVDGTYEYYVIAHDMGGWSTESNEITVIVDSKNPDIEITGTVPGIGFFIATYTVTDSEPSSGIDRIEVTGTDGYALCSGTLPNGFCTVFLGSELELTVYDKAGNSDIDSTSGTEKDITPPTIIYSSPSGVIAYNDPILEARTNESSTCYYGINDNITEMTQMTADGGKTTHTVNLGALTDGLKVYHVICKDLAENYMDSSKTIVFYIDTTGNYELAIPDYGHYWSVGWNTFFLPKDMLDDICGVENGGPYNVTKVLSSLDGSNPSFDMIWYFDGVDWLYYNLAYPSDSTLTEFNDEQSLPYYIRMIREDRLEITQDICPV
jgi:hypothetical protein